MAMQAWILIAPGASSARAADPAASLPECFFVIHRGTALLDAHGDEIERLDPVTNGAGALSRDGRWVAYSRSGPGRAGRNQFIVKSRVDPRGDATVPMAWGDTGSSVLPIWSPDSKRLLLCELGWNEQRQRDSSFRIYDVASRSCAPVNLSQRWWPNDWSADGKRVLTSVGSENTIRLAWVNIDGSGQPEFVTSPAEVAYRGLLSPDNRRILCMHSPRDAEGKHGRERLTVIDLATKATTIVDRPGHTDSFCWSSDGRKVAYTWQAPLVDPERAPQRRAYLVTCDADGANRRTVASRTYDIPGDPGDAKGVIIFFQVCSWWR